MTTTTPPAAAPDQRFVRFKIGLLKRADNRCECHWPECCGPRLWPNDQRCWVRQGDSPPCGKCEGAGSFVANRGDDGALMTWPFDQNNPYPTAQFMRENRHLARWVILCDRCMGYGRDTTKPAGVLTFHRLRGAAGEINDADIIVACAPCTAWLKANPGFAASIRLTTEKVRR